MVDNFVNNNLIIFEPEKTEIEMYEGLTTEGSMNYWTVAY